MDLLVDRLDSLSYLVRPPREAGSGLLHPVLCFLHGDGGRAPSRIQEALARDGPLRNDASARAREFLVIAPQLPHGGDQWNRHSAVVREILLDARARFRGDPRRTYVTGAGFGANGALDYARLQPELWAAIWAVDPTRAPRRRLRQPLWLTLGATAREQEKRFVGALGLAPAGARPKGDRLYDDIGRADPSSAYADPRPYAWLLARQATLPDAPNSGDHERRPARRSAWYETALRAAGEGAPRRARR